MVTASERERERSVRACERARDRERARKREREMHSPFPGVMLYRTETEFREREGARERDRERDLISVCDLSLAISPCPLGMLCACHHTPITSPSSQLLLLPSRAPSLKTSSSCLTDAGIAWSRPASTSFIAFTVNKASPCSSALLLLQSGDANPLVTNQTRTAAVDRAKLNLLA